MSQAWGSFEAEMGAFGAEMVQNGAPFSRLAPRSAGLPRARLGRSGSIVGDKGSVGARGKCHLVGRGAGFLRRREWRQGG